jgi:hypothetical protein
VVVGAINGSDSVKLLSISMVFSSNDMVLFLFLYFYTQYIENYIVYCFDWIVLIGLF